MTISQAILAVSKDFDRESHRAQDDPAFYRLMTECVRGEYEEMDQGLTAFLIGISRAHDVPPGTIVPPSVYEMARMCFSLGMRVQRKLDRPGEATSVFWRSDQEAV